MTYLPLFAATVEEIAAKNPGSTTLLQRLTVRDQFMILGAALAIAVLLIMWAAFFRKREDPHDHPAPPHRPDREVDEENDEHEPGERVKRRRRRRRRAHRPRNATLNETGGLPPTRSDDQAPPY